MPYIPKDRDLLFLTEFSKNSAPKNYTQEPLSFRDFFGNNQEGMYQFLRDFDPKVTYTLKTGRQIKNIHKNIPTKKRRNYGKPEDDWDSSMDFITGNKNNNLNSEIILLQDNVCEPILATAFINDFFGTYIVDKAGRVNNFTGFRQESNTLPNIYLSNGEHAFFVTVNDKKNLAYKESVYKVFSTDSKRRKYCLMIESDLFLSLLAGNKGEMLWALKLITEGDSMCQIVINCGADSRIAKTDITKFIDENSLPISCVTYNLPDFLVKYDKFYDRYRKCVPIIKRYTEDFLPDGFEQSLKQLVTREELEERQGNTFTIKLL